VVEQVTIFWVSYFIWYYNSWFKIFPSLGENVRSRIVIEFQDNYYRWDQVVIYLCLLLKLFKSQKSFDGKEVFKIGEPNTENIADGKVSRVVKYINPKNGTEYQCRLSLYRLI
jgi:hypothetical protein